MTPKELATRLAGRVDSVCRELLPKGKATGSEWRVGGVEGEPGQSLGVHLSGDRAGVWADFATGQSGDLLDLWSAVRGITLSQAIAEAKSYLGVHEPRPDKRTLKTYKRPEKPSCARPDGQVLEYLTGTRKLTLEALQAYKVAARGDSTVILPFLRDGELVMCKWRDIHSKDTSPTSKDQEPCLFGWQAIPANARTITICEGEFDAITLWQYGHPALSVPFGGGTGAKHQWIESDFDHLERFDEIFLCFDMDEPGQKAAQDVAKRLGVHRCRVVALPHKDANECLQNGVEAASINECFRSAAYFDPEELRSATSYEDDIIKAFHGGDADEVGFEAPWERTRGLLRFRPAELTLVNGINGHGKSQLVGQLVLHAMAQGRRACIASMELKPARLLYRLTRQAAALESYGTPGVEHLRAISDWYGGKLWLFEVLGTAKGDRLLEVMAYAHRRYGVDVFVIDSLMKCGIDEDDYNGQKRFIDTLCDFKNETGVHVFLVTHSRKTESEMKAGDKFDVKGTGAIVDLCDTLISIWRNKPKEIELEKARVRGYAPEEKWVNQPDAALYCRKQRNGEWEGRVGLGWHHPSYQYVEGGRPTSYVKFVDTPAVLEAVA